MFNKLMKLFRSNKCYPCIHICLLCEEDIKVKELFITKCCGRVYDKSCFYRWERIFEMKPCCFNKK